jgi:hypothetical protein
MTKSEIGKLSLKILAIYALICALVSLAAPISILQLAGSPSRTSDNIHMMGALLLFIPTVLLFLFSGFLWLCANQPAAPHEPNTAETTGASGITPEILQNIAFSVTGIFVLIGTFPYLVNLIMQIRLYLSGFVGSSPNRMQIGLDLAEVLIRLGLGCWLVLGSNRLRVLGMRLRDSLGKSRDW